MKPYAEMLIDSVSTSQIRQSGVQQINRAPPLLLTVGIDLT